MILVDSSVWIDFFASNPGPAGRELHRLIEGAAPLAVTGVIVTEVLQGLTRGIDEIAQYLSMWDLLEPGGFATYREAAAIFRRARARGITLTTTDTLIAATAAEHAAAVFSLDKDFLRIARIARLGIYSPA